jgi:nitrite reductase/ring-hydroxylating ferredoxin subunit
MATPSFTESRRDALDADTSVDDWLLVCDVDELPPGEVFKIVICPPIAVFNVDGEYFAIDDNCSHSDYPLSDGYLDGDEIECTLHFATFSVRTGEALSAPAVRAVGTYPVCVRDDKIYVATKQRRVSSKSR